MQKIIETTKTKNIERNANINDMLFYQKSQTTGNRVFHTDTQLADIAS